MLLCLVFSLYLSLSLSLTVYRESGYLAVLSKLVPLRASPMNDVLIGWPARRPLAKRQSLDTLPAHVSTPLNESPFACYEVGQPFPMIR